VILNWLGVWLGKIMVMWNRIVSGVSWMVRCEVSRLMLIVMVIDVSVIYSVGR